MPTFANSDHWIQDRLTYKYVDDLENIHEAILEGKDHKKQNIATLAEKVRKRVERNNANLTRVIEAREQDINLEDLVVILKKEINLEKRTPATIVSYLTPLKIFLDDYQYLDKRVLYHAMKVATTLYSRWVKTSKDIQAKTTLQELFEGVKVRPTIFYNFEIGYQGIPTFLRRDDFKLMTITALYIQEWIRRTYNNDDVDMTFEDCIQLGRRLRQTMSDLYSKQCDGFICEEQNMDRVPPSVDDDTLVEIVDQLFEEDREKTMKMTTFLHAIMFIDCYSENTILDGRMEACCENPVPIENFKDY